MLGGLAAALGSAALFGFAAVVQARGARRGTGQGATADLGIVRFWLRAARDPLTLGVVVAYLVGFVLHAIAIWLLPLYLAQATISLSFPITAIAAARVGERLGGSELAAVLVATAGLGLVAAGAGAPGPSRAGVGFLVAAVGTLLLVTLVVHLLAGMSARARALGLASAAGLGYAMSAIVVRGVETPTRFVGSEALVVLATAATVPALGAASFWLYSRALAAGSVASATAPMIVGQTVIPAAVGVLVLGDGFRPGWAPVVLLGLVAAISAVVWLSRTASEPATQS